MLKKTTKSNLSEGQIQKQILEYLQRLYIFHYRQNTIGFKGKYKSGKKGSADIVIIKKGWHIEVEVKKEDGKQSADQKKYNADLIDAGGHYILAHSFSEFLRQYNQIIKIIYKLI